MTSLGSSEQTVRLARALAHPLRIAILDALATKGTSPTALSREMDVRLSDLSYHLGQLRQLGFIRLAKGMRKRGAMEHLYEATPDAGNLNCRSTTLDAKGLDEVAGILAKAEKRISRVEARASKRLAKAGDRGAQATIVLAGLGPTAKADEARRSRRTGRK